MKTLDIYLQELNQLWMKIMPYIKETKSESKDVDLFEMLLKMDEEANCTKRWF